MSEIGDHVADTHCLIWHLTENARLSSTARAAMADADASNRGIVAPSIVLVEVVYLVERRRVTPDLVDHMLGYIADPNRPYRLAVLDADVVRAVRRVSREAAPDMPDRIIAATALSLGLPLISADERIRKAAVVPGVW